MFQMQKLWLYYFILFKKKMFSLEKEPMDDVTSKYDGRFKWIISCMVIIVKLFLLIKL